jgi:hypothetical protein
MQTNAVGESWRQALAIFEQLGVPLADNVRARIAALDDDPSA